MRLACWITKVTDTHSEYVNTLHFNGNNVYANAPHCYVTHRLHCPSSRHPTQHNTTKHFYFVRIAVRTSNLISGRICRRSIGPS